MIIKYRQMSIILIAILLAVPLTSIASPNTPSQSFSMPFIMAYSSDIGELNPLYWHSEESHWYAMLVYDTLLSYDDNHSIIPWLASNYQVSTDGLQINFTIREGVSWHDGHPLTADDVAFTFEYIRDAPSDVNYWRMLQNLTSATVFGNKVVCEFNEVYSFALHTLGEVFIIPEHIWSGYSADNQRWDEEEVVLVHTGSGPFQYIERVANQYTELARFDNWWGPDNPHIGQLPNIDSVRIDVIGEQDDRISAMRNGSVDTQRNELFGSYLEEIQTYPELQLITDVPSQSDYVLGFNRYSAPFYMYDIRKATTLAMNRNEIINYACLGYGTPTMSAIPEAFFPELYDASTLFVENVTQANEILDDAGYVDLDGDGIRNYLNSPYEELRVDILTPSWDSRSIEAGSAISLQMEEIGIQGNVIILDDGPFYDRVYSDVFDAVVIAPGYDAIPDHLWWRCHSSNMYDYGENIYNLDHASVDGYMEDYIHSTPATLADNAIIAADAISNFLPYVPLFLADDTHPIRSEWVNYSTSIGGVFSSFNPRTMVFMYDTSEEIEESTSTTTTMSFNSPSLTTILIWSISIGSLGVIIVISVLIYRHRQEL